MTRALYVPVLFLIPAITIFGHALAPNAAVYKGQDLGTLGAILATGIAVVLWLFYRPTNSWTHITLIFLVILAATWLYQIVRTQLDQSLFNLTAFIVPVALVLIGLKSVVRRDLDSALLVLGYSLLAISALSLALGITGAMPDGFEVSDSGPQRLPLLVQFGIENRWGGPFGSVNYASPAGGLVLVIGMGQRRWNRVVLVAGGFGMLTLGAGRSAVVAVVAALVVLCLSSAWVSRLTWHRGLRVGTIGAGLVLLVGYVAFLDPTLNGRTRIWSDFLVLVPTSPITGVGESGILAFVGERTGTEGFVPHTHGHSVLFDGILRYGLIMGVLILIIFAFALWAGGRSLRRGSSLPLALGVYVIAAGLTETIHGWGYWSIYLVTLVWIVLSSDDHLSARSPTSTETSLS
jgi:hypothetical protein